MTEYSENGWPVLGPGQLTWFTAAGERFAAATDDVAYVAAYLITRFNAEVEPLAGPVLDDWSYAERDVRGSTTTISNHASATAWDLNSIKHPRGVKGTFTAAATAAVRKILAAIIDDDGERIFRWGNDYVTAPTDSMHFEINATAEQVRQARARLEAEADMQLTDTITLTATQAATMNANGATHKAGDKVSVAWLLIWGGPAMERLFAHIRAQETVLKTLATAVQALAAASPADVKAAFEQGISDLRAEVASINISVTAE